jgi:transposase InsO family protein
VIDIHARHIVGWQVRRTAHADFVLDALDQAIHIRPPAHRGRLIHHSDRTSQYVSIICIERLAKAGFEQPIGNIPPAKTVERYFAMLDDMPMAA